MIETTCTDCTGPIELSESEIKRLSRSARLCQQCRKIREEHGYPVEQILPPGMGNYRCRVELQWSLIPEDLYYESLGDHEADFALRSLYRVRGYLEMVAGCGSRRSPIANYHLGIEESGHDPGLRRCAGRSIEEEVPGLLAQYHEALADLVDLLDDLSMLGDVRQRGEMIEKVSQALAIGLRQGWRIPPALAEEVGRREDLRVPLSYREAKRRLLMMEEL